MNKSERWNNIIAPTLFSVQQACSKEQEEILKNCKTILLLAIPAGTTGSPFDDRVLTKIGELRKIYSGSILIDGGINKITYQKVIEVGATEAGENSAYWKGEV